MQPYQPAKLLCLHFTEQDRYQDKPLYQAIVETCRDMKIAGASVFRGIEGFSDDAEIHRSHLLTHDLPIVIQIVDTDENIQRLLPVVEDMMDQGLIAIADVNTLRVSKTGGTPDV